jgi:hypothetical protein
VSWVGDPVPYSEDHRAERFTDFTPIARRSGDTTHPTVGRPVFSSRASHSERYPRLPDKSRPKPSLVAFDRAAFAPLHRGGAARRRQSSDGTCAGRDRSPNSEWGASRIVQTHLASPDTRCSA